MTKENIDTTAISFMLDCLIFLRFIIHPVFGQYSPVSIVLEQSCDVYFFIVIGMELQIWTISLGQTTC